MTAPFPFIRNVAGLRGRKFDLLVIGGGIYGAWTAY
ncbi:MAG: glycerol-3-phosphate dehydrogenase/oxidase, partial [Nevskia sp.]|nr:glycerol-3-phosphate dehydrogenase/oxidase [Nevskia sp.]